ncbi:MAG: MFS transporter [Labilithrix sp.]|nr:MFS transporter [Labilithrix sp.]
MSDPRVRAGTAGVACAGAFVTALSTSLVAVAAPGMARDLGVVQADVGWVLSAYLLTTSCLLAGAGRLADVLGRRKVYLTGFSIFAIAGLLCGLAPTLGALVAARVVQGLGACAVMATSPALVTRAFPAELRARGLGIQLAATYTGLTLGPTIGGAITSALGWHAVFFAVAAGSTIPLALAYRWLEPDEPPERERPPLDVAGSALVALALAAILVALRRGPEGATGQAAALLALAAGAGVVFVRHEAKHPAPVLPLSLLRTPAFAFGIAGATILYVVVFVLAWLLPFHLQHARGMDARHAGAIMTAQPATMALVAPMSGWIADRFGPRLPSVAGMLVIAGGMWLAGRASASSDADLALALAVVGVGSGLYVAPNNAVIMTAAPRERQGTAGAMAATARNAGMTCGVALAVVLHDATSFRGALGVAAAIALAGALLGVVRPVKAS